MILVLFFSINLRNDPLPIYMRFYNLNCTWIFSQDDLSFKLEYVHPYLDGVYNPRNRTLRGSCFNSRKLSPVFTGGPGVDEVPPIWVDRAGMKANITEVTALLHPNLAACEHL